MAASCRGYQSTVLVFEWSKTTAAEQPAGRRGGWAWRRLNCEGWPSAMARFRSSMTVPLPSAIAGRPPATEHGRRLCRLGPSGCGKTPTLRLSAGFVEPSAGEIRVGDQLISSPARTLPPERRNMSMIFQSYALWPHMTVAENVAYGLK